MARYYAFIFALSCLTSYTLLHAGGKKSEDEKVILTEIIYERVNFKQEIEEEKDTSDEQQQAKHITIDEHEYKNLKEKASYWSTAKSTFISTCFLGLFILTPVNISSWQSIETMNSLASPVTTYPYVNHNGTLIAPEIEYDPACSYYNLTSEKTNKDYIIEDCDGTLGQYMFAYDRSRLVSMLNTFLIGSTSLAGALIGTSCAIFKSSKCSSPKT